MIILNSMTGATPETKLILIISLARGLIDLHTAAKNNLVDLGLSKRHVKEAYDYLVRERFFWTIRGHSSFTAKVQTKKIIDYRFTDECNELWQKSIDECRIWHLEFLQLLADLSFTSSKLRLSPNSMRASMLLVWGMLLTRANQAGYVIGVDSLALQKLLGLSEAKIDRSLSALADASCITLAAQGMDHTFLFEPFKTIYRIHPVRHENKVIKLGVGLSFHSIMPLRFMTLLQNEYKLAQSKNKKIAIAPSDYYLLSNEQYYRLLEIFSNNDICNYIQHICLSIVFSLVSDSIIFYRCINDASQAGASNGEIQKEIRIRVKQAVNEYMSIDGDGGEYYNYLDRDNDFDYKPLMTSVITIINSDLCQVVLSMSKRWRILTEKLAIYDARIIGYLPKYRMKSVIKSDEKHASSDLGEEKENKLLSIANFVFEVYVPNKSVICDYSVVQGGLYQGEIMSGV